MKKLYLIATIIGATVLCCSCKTTHVQKVYKIEGETESLIYEKEYVEETETESIISEGYSEYLKELEYNSKTNVY